MSEKPQSTARLGLWLTFAAFLLIIIVFKNQISEIHFDAKGVSAKMNSQDAGNLSPEDRKNAQDELAQRVSTLEQQAKSHPPPATEEQETSAPANPDTQESALPNLSGYWTSPAGTQYLVNQYGNYIAISELNQGITDAVATGQIFGWSFKLPSYNLAGNPGVLTLTVSPDQRQMTGQYYNMALGTTVPMQLSR